MCMTQIHRIINSLKNDGADKIYISKPIVLWMKYGSISKSIIPIIQYYESLILCLMWGSSLGSKTDRPSSRNMVDDTFLIAFWSRICQMDKCLNGYVLNCVFVKKASHYKILYFLQDELNWDSYFLRIVVQVFFQDSKRWRQQYVIFFDDILPRLCHLLY